MREVANLSMTKWVWTIINKYQRRDLIPAEGAQCPERGLPEDSGRTDDLGRKYESDLTDTQRSQ